jgi:hypothetical protein
VESIGPVRRGFDGRDGDRISDADGANIGGRCPLVDARGSAAVGSSSSPSGAL